MMAAGTVKWLDPIKEFGFIQRDAPVVEAMRELAR
jgi:cold shock CspA family protein